MTESEARLREAAQAVVDECRHDSPPSLGAVERLRAALAQPAHSHLCRDRSEASREAHPCVCDQAERAAQPDAGPASEDRDLLRELGILLREPCEPHDRQRARALVATLRARGAAT